MFGEVYKQCPLSFLDEGCIQVANLINMSTGGMGGISALPSQLLEETQLFFNAYSHIARIDGEIEDFKKKQKEQRNG